MLRTIKGGENMGFSINIPLYKRDEERRLVWGRATREELDKSNEIMDYASSKPNFEAWSNDFAARTGGKSSIGSWKNVYYMVNVIISIVTINARGRK